MTGIKTASQKKSEYIVRKMSYNNKQLWFNGEIDSSEEKEITFFFFLIISYKKRITKGSKEIFFQDIAMNRAVPRDCLDGNSHKRKIIPFLVVSSSFFPI